MILKLAVLSLIYIIFVIMEKAGYPNQSQAGED